MKTPMYKHHLRDAKQIVLNVEKRDKLNNILKDTLAIDDFNGRYFRFSIKAKRMFRIKESEYKFLKSCEVSCAECGGDGYTTGHAEAYTHSPDGECTICPVKIVCQYCGGQGKLFIKLTK